MTKISQMDAAGANSAESWNDSRSPTPTLQPQRKKKATSDDKTGSVTALPTPSPPPMTNVACKLPLLICGIGNPSQQYANTLHSAGLTILNRLADYLSYPQFSKDRSLGNGLVSHPPVASETPSWTLWQSTAYMNESGKGVKAAYTNWSRHLADGEGRLVVVHDELEKPLGSVTVRVKEGGSARGHNGIKSINSVMGGMNFVRIGIGIGRPVSRESGDVAGYVLKKMTAVEKAKVEGCVEEVVRRLREIEKG